MNQSTHTILYIEDDTTARDIICSLIRDRYGDLSVVDAWTAEEGLELYKTLHQPVVLTDINLTNSSGVAMARSIRAIDPGAVIIFVTGHSDAHLEEFTKSGPSHVLVKPIDCLALFTLVDTYIRIPEFIS